MSLQEAYHISAAPDLDLNELGYGSPQPVYPDVPQLGLVEPQDIINQYYGMLDNSGVPVQWEVRQNKAEFDSGADESEPDFLCRV